MLYDLNALIERSSVLRAVVAEYSRYKLDVPQTVADEITELNSKILEVSRNERKARLTKLRAQAEALMPVDEKRKRLQELIAELEQAEQAV